MASTFPPDRAELIETFEELEDWEERYEFLLDIGRELPRLDPELQTEENRVHGCMSVVWLHMDQLDKNKPVRIQADSDSMIVRGLIVVLLSIFHQKKPAQVLAEDPESFFATLGLNQHLSPNRRNGLYSMVGRIRELGIQLEAKNN